MEKQIIKNDKVHSRILRIAVTVVLCGFFLLTSSEGGIGAPSLSRDQQSDSLRSQAQKALDVSRERGDPQAMSEALADLIRLNPDERRHYLDRGYLLAYMGDFEEALQVYDQLRERLGSDEESMLSKARVLRAMDNLSEAIATLETLMDHSPKENIVYLTLSEYYTLEGRTDDALRVLDSAAGRFPGNPLIILAKADAYHAAGDLDQAFRYLEEGFSSNELDIDAKAGVLYNMLERRTFSDHQLLAIAEKFLTSNSADARAHAVHGDVHLQLGNFKRAEESYDQALKLDPRVPGIWMQLLQVLVFTGDIGQAQQMGAEASALFPREADILMITGNAFLAGKDYPKARKYIEAALNNENQEDSEALTRIYSTLGGVYHKLGMHAESDVAFSEALVHDSLNVFALNNYAYYLAVRKQHLEKAAAMSSRTLTLVPDEATYEDTYAWVLFQMERYEEALVWIRRAIANSENVSPTLLEHYGDILYRNGKSREAISQWKKAIKQADANYENLDKLAQKIDERRIVD